MPGRNVALLAFWLINHSWEHKDKPPSSGDSCCSKLLGSGPCRGCRHWTPELSEELSLWCTWSKRHRKATAQFEKNIFVSPSKLTLNLFLIFLHALGMPVKDNKDLVAFKSMAFRIPRALWCSEWALVDKLHFEKLQCWKKKKKSLCVGTQKITPSSPRCTVSTS